MENKVFGRLTVIKRDTMVGRWICKCECGNTTSVRADHLNDGHVKSCGCLTAESSRKRFTKHGMSNSRLHGIWVGMRQRCNNPKNTSYGNYGGRGIKVCEAWSNNFQTFYDWAVLNGYSDELSIDRVDTDGNYEPSNCRWATAYLQERNKRNNRTVDADGTEMILADYCEKYGLSYHMVLKRLLRGWEMSDAITIPSMGAAKK